MCKKLVTLITLVAFIIYSQSCAVYSTKQEKVDKVKTQEKILGVLKTSGEKIEFSEKTPGILSKNNITCNVKKEVEIEKSNFDKVERNKEGKITRILTKDGKTYPVIDPIQEKDNKIIIVIYEQVSIPLSEVEMVWVKKINPVGTFFATIGALALTGGIILLIALLTKESCPFIYSFDGEKYIFDAEPYGGATCQGLQRTEWCGLEHLREVNGQYKIKITNEVDETQYTDELRLAVVDHPRGVKVFPDESGNIHTISQPIIPVRASDSKGNDLIPYLSENDWIFWQTQTEGKSPERIEDLKEELIFEFPKPEGTTKVKLLFNGCNTLWASQMVKQYLELYGSKVHECYEKMNSIGTAYNMLMNWNEREELYRLQIRVGTKDGWKSKGTIVGGGPFAAEDKVYTIDLSDVPGDTLKIKLTPPATFWMINYLAIDYTENLPIKVTEIEAIKATDYKGQDVRELLANEDSTYFVMPNIGDAAELVFESPTATDNLERSVILKASGYYDIHLEAKGEPQREIITKFLTEPGFSIQYAFKEYLKWKKLNMARLGQN